jgi:integrase
MSPRGPRVRIARGIYRDRYGFAVVVKGQEKRYPPNTPLDTMQRWRQDLGNRLKVPRKTRERGTLAHDVEVYTKRIQHLASWRERRAELRAWIALYGPWLRSRIRHEHVLTARQKWLDAGVSPKTCNHRVDALRQLWRGLDGKRAPTPCDEVDPLNVPRQPVKTVSPDTVRAVYLGLLRGEAKGTLRNAKTRARYMVLAASGVRPSELMRAQAGDVDLDARVWRTRDGKGGVRPGGLYLHDDLLEAWQVFVKADAWGKYETSAFARTLREAGWPEGVRPYQLRASVGVALSEAGNDLADVGAWLGHSRIDTTRAHYVPVLAGRMKGAGESLNGRIGWPSLGSSDWHTGETAH